MFSYSTGYYVSPPDDQYLKFKNRCSLMVAEDVGMGIRTITEFLLIGLWIINDHKLTTIIF